jgi:hypothetical protein
MKSIFMFNNVTTSFGPLSYASLSRGFTAGVAARAREGDIGGSRF